MKTPEGKLKDEVKKYLKSIGAYYFMPVQTGYGAASLDFLCCVHGRFLGIETKSPIYPPTPTPRQAQVMQAIEDAYGATVCCNSVDQLDEFLRLHKL